VLRAEGQILRADVGGLHVEVRSDGIDLVPMGSPRDEVHIDALDGPTSPVRLERGIGAQSGPDGDRFVLTDGTRIEELRLLPSIERRALRFRLRLGPGIEVVREREGYVELVRASGLVALSAAPMWMVDARGEKRALVPVVEQHGREAILRIEIDPRGLTPPILVDPAWSAVASPRFDHTAGAAALLASGRVLMSGGIPAHTNAETYDPATNTWTTVGAMTAARGGHQMLRLSSGKVLHSPPHSTPGSMTPKGNHRAYLQDGRRRHSDAVLVALTS